MSQIYYPLQVLSCNQQGNKILRMWNALMAVLRPPALVGVEGEGDCRGSGPLKRDSDAENF